MRSPRREVLHPLLDIVSGQAYSSAGGSGADSIRLLTLIPHLGYTFPCKERKASAAVRNRHRSSWRGYGGRGSPETRRLIYEEAPHAACGHGWGGLGPPAHRAWGARRR